MSAGPFTSDDRWRSLQAAVDRIRYKDWYPRVMRRSYDAVLTWQWFAPDSTAMASAPWRWQESRAWVIPACDWTNPGAIFRLAFLAAKTAEEHELMEFFQVDGKPLFDPHAPLACEVAKS